MSFKKCRAIVLAAITGILAFGATPASAGTCRTTHVVVYGGTPAGVIAAVQARRMGKSVMMIVPNVHIGGMMANGLTRTDYADQPRIYGGLVKAFFDHAIEHYHLTDPIRVYFESRWAENTLKGMAERAGVKIFYNQHLLHVSKRGPRLTQLRMTSGETFCGKVFIDATYTADLAYRARVDTILGRESRAQYGESLAGVRPLERLRLLNGKELDIDPYVIPGNPSSGLLPGVEPYERRTLGAADDRVMAYNYRVCVTADPDNRVPFTKPPGYNREDYELLARFIQEVIRVNGSLARNHFIGGGETVNGEYDKNSNFWISTDVSNIGTKYITGTLAERAAIRQQIETYTRGYFWFGQTDPAVPIKVRQYTATFGYCKDEFRDNSNFPRQLYVREGRRIVGSFVLTQNDLIRHRRFPDSIGVGYYPLDTHNMYRTVLHGTLVDETGLGQVVGRYGIPYRVLLPNSDQAINLLVVGGPSVSHIGFSSIRVEPTLMVLGQAAGVAAGMAPDGDVFRVPVHQLRAHLRRAGAYLDPPHR